jgi:hypothetical protein
MGANLQDEDNHNIVRSIKETKRRRSMQQILYSILASALTGLGDFDQPYERGLKGQSTRFATRLTNDVNTIGGSMRTVGMAFNIIIPSQDPTTHTGRTSCSFSRHCISRLCTLFRALSPAALKCIHVTLLPLDDLPFLHLQ